MAFRGHLLCRGIFSSRAGSNCKIVQTHNAIRPMTTLESKATKSTFYLQCNKLTTFDHRATSIFSSSYRVEQRHDHTSPSVTRNFSTAFTKSAYIHPLSQIVLEHLQSNHSHWVEQMGLDTRLKLNKDGTFALRFPSPDGADTAEEGSGTSEENTGLKNGSIWTMYEPEEKKHYLCVSKGSLVGRYMLQDNTKPAWHSDKRSTPERVQDAVDEMIEKLYEVERAV